MPSGGYGTLGAHSHILPVEIGIIHGILGARSSAWGGTLGAIRRDLRGAIYIPVLPDYRTSNRGSPNSVEMWKSLKRTAATPQKKDETVAETMVLREEGYWIEGRISGRFRPRRNPEEFCVRRRHLPCLGGFAPCDSAPDIQLELS